MSISLQDIANSFPSGDSRNDVPHSMSEFYDVPFSDGTSSTTSGQISLNAFRNKTVQLSAPANPNPTSTTYITSTISPSPLTYTLSNYTYQLNIAGPNGPQSTSTPQNSVSGVDIHSNDQVTMRVYDSRFSGYSQLRFWGNYESVFRNSITRSENDTFNNRYGPISNYTILTAKNVFNADAVVSCIIPIPGTVSQIDFYYTKTQPWAGFSITI